MEFIKTWPATPGSKIPQMRTHLAREIESQTPFSLTQPVTIASRKWRETVAAVISRQQ